MVLISSLSVLCIHCPERRAATDLFAQEGEWLADLHPGRDLNPQPPDQLYCEAKCWSQPAVKCKHDYIEIREIETKFNKNVYLLNHRHRNLAEFWVPIAGEQVNGEHQRWSHRISLAYRPVNGKGRLAATTTTVSCSTDRLTRELLPELCPEWYSMSIQQWYNAN